MVHFFPPGITHNVGADLTYNKIFLEFIVKKKIKVNKKSKINLSPFANDMMISKKHIIESVKQLSEITS